MDVGWMVQCASRRRIRSYSIWNTAGGIYTIHCMATTRLIKPNSLLFDLDDGMGFTTVVDKGGRNAVYDIHHRSSEYRRYTGTYRRFPD
jgi:hypothetical protein